MTAMLSLVLLAAGLSQRFGSPKALAKIGQATVIEHLQCMLISSFVDEIVIVLGAAADEIKPYLLKHKKVKFVYNKDYKLGQTSSFQTGLKACDRDSEGFFLLPADFPFIQKETINQLVTRFKQDKPFILIPAYEGRRGHPPGFAASLKKEFLNLQTAEGCHFPARRHAKRVQVLPLTDPAVVASFNTPAEWDVLRATFSSALQ